MVYFTADTHFNHDNIIKYCDRPYNHVRHMNADLIRNWNSVVNEDDTIYVIGDFSLSDSPEFIKKTLGKLNGTKHLILGNHDELKPFTYTNIGFKTVHTALELKISDDEVYYLSHDPVHSITKRDDIWIVGHVHTMFKTLNNTINVGVDVWDYKPVSIEVIRETMQDWKRHGK